MQQNNPLLEKYRKSVENQIARQQEEQLSALPIEEQAPPALRMIGVCFKTYILVECRNQLLIIDQHAAHERLMYERLKKMYAARTMSQNLLVPLVLSVSAAEWQVIEEHLDLLAQTGLTVEPFGEHEMVVRSVPIVLGQPQA